MGAREKIDTKGAWHFAIIKDVRETARRFWDDLGVGPWQFLTVTGENVELHGKPVELKVAAGITRIGSMLLALDKALTSPGPYDEIEVKRGGGAHHLAFLVDDLDKAEMQMRQRGYGVILRGRGLNVTQEGGGDYFDTIADFGTVIEFAQLPNQMPAPDDAYPGPDAQAPGGNVGIKGAVHLALAVRDAEKTAQHYADLLGIGPWQIVTFGSEVEKATYQGREIALSMKVAHVDLGPFVLCLEQPLSGPGPLQDFLDRNGEGIHHVCLAVDNVEAAVAEMERRGYKTIFTASGFGPNRDGKTAYFDTERTLGITIELAEVPRGM